SQNLPDDAPVDFADLQALARKVLRRDCGMHDPRFLSRFHSEERQARRYRVGRVFLAGDAAHVHSPAGGMGMNTGLQDAANLSWKLAAATRGRAPEGLLDSYQDERHPVGTATTRASHVLLRAALLRNPLARGVRNLLGGTLMRLPFARRRASEQVSGIGIGYDAPSGAHPLVGRRAPDLALHGGGRLYEALRHGRFVLVASDHEALDTEPAEVVAAIPATPAAEVMLVRPDGHIGWAAERPDPADVRRALARWGCAPVGQQAA
ncbi:MAG: FAD-dependent monooxygenase, partial [Micromonosporaceae bacterium]